MATRAPEPVGPDQNSITQMLVQLSAGNRAVEAELIPQVYAELRRLAAIRMRAERRGARGDHTLQPSALVNEAYARLVQPQKVPWQNRAHFYATASRQMRRILVDHARKRLAEKRGGLLNQVTLDDALLPSQNRTVDVLILNEALEELARFDARQAKVVELHFFGGLSFAEIAEVLDVSERTIKRDWSMSRAWLKGRLTE